MLKSGAIYYSWKLNKSASIVFGLHYASDANNFICDLRHAWGGQPCQLLNARVNALESE